MSTATETIEGLVQKEYKYGFYTDVEADSAPPGLNEDIVRLISSKKNEPPFMLEWPMGYFVRSELRKKMPLLPDPVISASRMKSPYGFCVQIELVEPSFARSLALSLTMDPSRIAQPRKLGAPSARFQPVKSLPLKSGTKPSSVIRSNS